MDRHMKWVVYDLSNHPLPVAIFDTAEDANDWVTSIEGKRFELGVMPLEVHCHFPGEES